MKRETTMPKRLYRWPSQVPASTVCTAGVQNALEVKELNRVAPIGMPTRKSPIRALPYLEMNPSAK